MGLVNPVQFDNINQMITLSVRTQSRTTLSSASTKKNEVPNFPGLGFICQPLKLVRHSFVCLFNIPQFRFFWSFCVCLSVGMFTVYFPSVPCLFVCLLSCLFVRCRFKKIRCLFVCFYFCLLVNLFLEF